MTNEMKYLMHLYACAATSVSASLPKYPVDYETLYALADRMSLLSMLSYALKISPDTGCPDDIKSRLYTIMLGTSLKNKMKIESVLEVLGDIEKKGIKATIIKGLDCARYYSKPECRISADTDLFIDKKDEEKLLSYFEQNGYTVRRRTKHQHHSECVNSKTGMIEVHTKIWEDSVYGAMFKKVKKLKLCVDDSINVFVNGKQISVLNPTDAIIFMTLHLVKHFMFSCANLKMSYDLALYYINNKESVDTEKYKNWVKMSGYETIVSAVFSAMVLFCDFNKEDFDKITFFNEQNGKIYADSIEQYNSSDDEHRPDTLLLLEYCTTQSNIKKRGKLYAFLFNAKKTIKIKLSVLFPKMSHLKESYPYLRKHPYLYLAACVHRFFNRGTKHVFHADPKNGKVFGYRENLDTLLSEHEESKIQTLKDMELL